MFNSDQIIVHMIVSENPAAPLTALDRPYLHNRQTFLNLFLDGKL